MEIYSCDLRKRETEFMPTFLVDFSNDSRVCALKEHMSLFFSETKAIFA